MENVQDGVTGEGTEAGSTTESRKKKKSKVRSAWISFIGRIIAQVLGAVATITLGLALADRLRLDSSHTVAAIETRPAYDLPSQAVQHDPRPSVAVLPLELYSPDPDQRHLADAMTEQLIAELMAVPGLRVVSRTSTARYRLQPGSMPEIARELGVDVVIEGCLVRERERIRVSARVIEAARDAHLGTATETRRPHELLIRTPGLASAMAHELAAIIFAAFPPD